MLAIMNMTGNKSNIALFRQPIWANVHANDTQPRDNLVVESRWCLHCNLSLIELTQVEIGNHYFKFKGCNVLGKPLNKVVFKLIVHKAAYLYT